MRKTILLIAGFLFACTFISNGQTEQGRFVIGGNSTFGLMGNGSDLMSIGISTVKYKSDADGFEEQDPTKLTSFNFIPKLGIFVANNLLIGLDVSIAYQKSKSDRDDYSSEYSQTLLAAGPYLRYYIPTSFVKPFIEVSGSYGMIKYKNYRESYDYINDNESEDQLTSISGGIGVAFPIGNNASFDLSANYSSFTTKEKKDNDDNYRTVVGSLGVKFGFIIFLGN